MSATAVEAETDPNARAQRIARRGHRVSDELRKSARALRAASAKPAPAWARISRRALDYRRFTNPGTRWPRLIAPICGFAIPALIVAGYIAFGVSNQYTSEARLAVRGGEHISADPMSAMAAMASFTRAQDTLIVVNYVKSRAIVEALDRSIGLREMYSRVDWLSRFRRADPIEDLVKYWRWKIDTNVDPSSGIITIRVSAFSPQDTLEIANAVVSASEQLVNSMSARATRDAMEQAQNELTRAERRLGDVRVALQNLRDSQATINPRRTAEGINKLIGELRLERARLEDDANSARRSQVVEEAPQMQLLRVRIQAISDQIDELEHQLTSNGPAGGAVSGKINRFDELELERQIAEKQYTLATEAFESARVNAERQKVYLTTFVVPLLPHDVAWPKHRWLWSILGLAAVAGLYWLGNVVVTNLPGRKMVRRPL